MLQRCFAEGYKSGSCGSLSSSLGEKKDFSVICAEAASPVTCCLGFFFFKQRFSLFSAGSSFKVFLRDSEKSQPGEYFCLHSLKWVLILFSSPASPAGSTVLRLMLAQDHPGNGEIDTLLDICQIFRSKLAILKLYLWGICGQCCLKAAEGPSSQYHTCPVASNTLLVHLHLEPGLEPSGLRLLMATCSLFTWNKT